MTTKTIRGYLIDPEKGIAEERTIEKSLDSYYATLGCTCIDIVTRRVRGESFDLICDDEALLREDPVPSALDACGRPLLCGPLFVVRFDGREDVTDLTSEDIRTLERRIWFYTRPDWPHPRPSLRLD